MHSHVQKTTGNFPKTKTKRSNPRTSLESRRKQTIFSVHCFIRNTSTPLSGYKTQSLQIPVVWQSQKQRLWPFSAHRGLSMVDLNGPPQAHHRRDEGLRPSVLSGTAYLQIPQGLSTSLRSACALRVHSSSSLLRTSTWLNNPLLNQGPKELLGSTPRTSPLSH